MEDFRRRSFRRRREPRAEPSTSANDTEAFCKGTAVIPAPIFRASDATTLTARPACHPPTGLVTASVSLAHGMSQTRPHVRHTYLPFRGQLVFP